MKFQYFPGCTLKTKGVRLDTCARKAALALGFTLEELPEWQCCGAVYPMARDEIATRLSSVRALVAAREAGEPLVTLCSACHHVIKRVNGDMKNDADIRAKVNNYLNLDEPYAGETEVLHYLEVLRDKIGWENVKAAVKNPLTGVKIGAYYGARAGRCASTIPRTRPFWRTSSAPSAQSRSTTAFATSAAAATRRLRTGSMPTSRRRELQIMQRQRARNA